MFIYVYYIYLQFLIIMDNSGYHIHLRFFTTIMYITDYYMYGHCAITIFHLLFTLTTEQNKHYFTFFFLTKTQKIKLKSQNKEVTSSLHRTQNILRLNIMLHIGCREGSFEFCVCILRLPLFEFYVLSFRFCVLTCAFCLLNGGIKEIKEKEVKQEKALTLLFLSFLYAAVKEIKKTRQVYCKCNRPNGP